MFIPKNLFFILFLSVALFACNTQKSSSGESQVEDSISLETEEPSKTPIYGITDNPNRFPEIDQQNDSTLSFHAYDVKFKLTHPNSVAPITSENLYWFNNIDSDENSGVFISYFFPGREVNLSSTHIRVDYLNKKTMPHSSHPDSILWSWKHFRLTGNGARVIKEIHPVKLAGGAEAKAMEIYSVMPDSVNLSPKYIALAYLEHGEDYLVGMNLTSLDSFEFEDAKPFFYEILESYQP